MKFQISLAGKLIQIESLHDQVYYLCRGYLTDSCCDKPDITIKINPSDIDFERQKSSSQGEASDYSDSYLETLAVYRKLATEMLNFDCWLIHGAVFSIDDKAYMVTAASGTGKTTIVRMILKLYEDSFVVNGDKPLLKINGNQTSACGTPWSGKEHMNRNCRVPLRALIILERGQENRVDELSYSQAFPIILQQTYKPDDVPYMKKTLELLSRMGNSDGLKFYRLSLKRYDNRNELVNEDIVSLLEQTLS